MAKKSRAKGKSIKSPLTREEVLYKIKSNQHFQERMKFTKEQFWPTLCEVSDSIEDATIFLEGFNTALMQSFLGLMKEKKFKDMELDTKIAGDYEKYKKVIVLFDDMDVFTAKDAIEGMKNEIELFRREEDRTRKLNSLTPKWLDELV